MFNHMVELKSNNWMKRKVNSDNLPAASILNKDFVVTHMKVKRISKLSSTKKNRKQMRPKVFLKVRPAHNGLTVGRAKADLRGEN